MVFCLHLAFAKDLSHVLVQPIELIPRRIAECFDLLVHALRHCYSLAQNPRAKILHPQRCHLIALTAASCAVAVEDRRKRNEAALCYLYKLVIVVSKALKR